MFVWIPNAKKTYSESCQKFFMAPITESLIQDMETLDAQPLTKSRFLRISDFLLEEREMKLHQELAECISFARGYLIFD